MDIMHDRAGYYICWGCLVWVPAVYTSPAMYLTMHGVDNLSCAAAVAIAFAGTAAIYINYDSDRQRQVQHRLCIIGNLRIDFGVLCKSVVDTYETGCIS